jgi:hypothetical protein
LPTRIAVIVSCSGLRERTCITTWPSATIGNAVLPADFLDVTAVRIVEGAVQQVQAEPGAAREGLRQPRGLLVQAVDVGRLRWPG